MCDIKSLKEKMTAARALIYSAYGDNGYTDELDDALYAIDTILGNIYAYEHDEEGDEEAFNS